MQIVLQPERVNAKSVSLGQSGGATNASRNSGDWRRSARWCPCKTGASKSFRRHAQQPLHGPCVFQAIRAGGQQSENRYKEGRQLGSSSRSRAKSAACLRPVRRSFSAIAQGASESAAPSCQNQIDDFDSASAGHALDASRSDLRSIAGLSSSKKFLLASGASR
jgi:hypothetical protein